MALSATTKGSLLNDIIIRPNQLEITYKTAQSALACWALITGNLGPDTTGDATAGMETIFALSSDDPVPEMA
ncbi:hypothetical protein NC653_013090 [Populus alba x Populus x berolinensis]|uniref:Uncharacterized protein n=1 Tax=Populus alba x Populus x berolinensis TaxID=444605 RepID=A0AAD6W269_9ROSI|nr:hypothetical protein NC653_013090 [Populus alba x Populus x berolinensis]